MKTYKYTDASNTVVHIIESNGVSYKSMLVTDRDDNIDEEYQEFLDWVAAGNIIIEA